MYNMGRDIGTLRDENQKLRAQNADLKQALSSVKEECINLRDELKMVSELAVTSIDKMSVLTEENQSLRKTANGVGTGVGTGVGRILDLDDDINGRCFLHSYLTRHGFAGNGRKEFIDAYFRKDKYLSRSL